MQIMAEPKARVSKGAIVRSFSMQVVVNCTCGAPEPIVIHFIPGLDKVKFFCPRCRTQYKLAKFVFNLEDGGNIQLGVGMVPPDLVVPSV